MPRPSATPADVPDPIPAPDHGEALADLRALMSTARESIGALIGTREWSSLPMQSLLRMVTRLEIKYRD